MPILVDKDSHWTESEEVIQLTLPLKGISPQNADVFCTSEYLKVSYAPYLFEALLRHKIDTKLSKILIANGSIQINLKKVESKIWGKLKSEQSNDRSVMKQKREEAFEEARNNSEEIVSERARTRDRQKKEGVSQQMNLESDIRQRIESVKESERDLAACAFDELREKEMTTSEKNPSEPAQEGVSLSLGKKKTVTFNLSDESDNSDTEIDKEKPPKSELETKVAKPSTRSKVSAPTTSNIFSGGLVESEVPIRNQGRIQCQFTPRFFPTPERESKKAEEEEWLAKLAEARRNPKSGLKPEVEPNDYPNTNPQWLKDRGDQLFRNGDFKSAYNAYSEAVKLETRLPSVYANRSLCLLKMLQYEDCIEDCDKALELSEPQVDANRRQRANIRARRGAAKAELGFYEDAISDYGMAIKLCPELESLKSDKAKLEVKITERNQAQVSK